MWEPTIKKKQHFVFSYEHPAKFANFPRGEQGSLGFFPLNIYSHLFSTPCIL